MSLLSYETLTIYTITF